MGKSHKNKGPGKRGTHSKHKSPKYNKCKLRTAFEERHVDQVWEDLRKPAAEVHDGAAKMGPVGSTTRVELDEDIPGGGVHFCIACSRYFQTAAALATHSETRPHKRTMKGLMTMKRPHNQKDADHAAGMGAADNGPRLRSSTAAAPMEAVAAC